jgi:outer membrane biosynthesis protein TonB
VAFFVLRGENSRRIIRNFRTAAGLVAGAGRNSPVQTTKMKTKSLVVIAGILALMGVAHAEEGKEKKAKKAISPELLEKYDKDKDGKLSKEEKAEMKKDKAAEPKPEKKPKTEKKPKGEKKPKTEKKKKDADN